MTYKQHLMPKTKSSTILTDSPSPYRELEAEKKAETARKKAERDALLAEEEASQPSTPKSANAKSAPKKSKGTLDLSQLNSPTSPGAQLAPALNASGIENALDALSLTTDPTGQKIDRHPERRFKAAYAAFEERRLPEIAEEHPGLRKQQRVEIVRKEFEKSEENPFNQAGIVGWDASKEEIKEAREKAREGVEERLAEKSP
jgi:Coiled-coil domain-containing protein 124 /Oxs1